MASSIHEFFGFPPEDRSAEAEVYRKNRICPFVDGPCIKYIRFGDERRKSGVCAIKPNRSDPVITCPQRMYAENYAVLRHVSEIAFGEKLDLVSGDRVCESAPTASFVAVFGHNFGKELHLPKRKGRGAYFVDWILARLTADQELIDFTAVEVQTIDTTGNYRDEVGALFEGLRPAGKSTASPNWENVNKRILPQIIYKGHVLRREPKCSKGLFFVCPTPVYDRICERLGGELEPIHPSTGALSFLHYSLEDRAPGEPRTLHRNGMFTTTVDNVALAFTAPKNLPPAGAYQNAIEKALR